MVFYGDQQGVSMCLSDRLNLSEHRCSRNGMGDGCPGDNQIVLHCIGSECFRSDVSGYEKTASDGVTEKRNLHLMRNGSAVGCGGEQRWFSLMLFNQSMPSRSCQHKTV